MIEKEEEELEVPLFNIDDDQYLPFDHKYSSIFPVGVNGTGVLITSGKDGEKKQIRSNFQPNTEMNKRRSRKNQQRTMQKQNQQIIKGSTIDPISIRNRKVNTLGEQGPK